VHYFTDLFLVTEIMTGQSLKVASCWVVGVNLGFFSVIDQNVFEITEKNLVISVRMSENIG